MRGPPVTLAVAGPVASQPHPGSGRGRGAVGELSRFELCGVPGNWGGGIRCVQLLELGCVPESVLKGELIMKNSASLVWA